MPTITQRNKRTGETRQIDTSTGEVMPQGNPQPIAGNEPEGWWGGFLKHLTTKEPAATGALMSAAPLVAGVAGAPAAAVTAATAAVPWVNSAARRVSQYLFGDKVSPMTTGEMLEDVSGSALPYAGPIVSKAAGAVAKSPIAQKIIGGLTGHAVGGAMGHPYIGGIAGYKAAPAVGALAKGLEGATADLTPGRLSTGMREMFAPAGEAASEAAPVAAVGRSARPAGWTPQSRLASPGGAAGAVPRSSAGALDEFGFPKQGPGTSIEWPAETGIGRQVTNAEGSTVAAPPEPTPVEPGNIKFANLAKMPASDLQALNEFMGGGLLPEEAAGIRAGIQEPPAPHLTPRSRPATTAEPVATNTFGETIPAPEALNLGNIEDYPSAGGSLESILGGLGEQGAAPTAHPLPFYKSGQRPLASPMSAEDFGRIGLPLPEGSDVSTVRGLRDTFGNLRGSPLNNEVRHWLRTYIRDQASRANAAPLGELGQ